MQKPNDSGENKLSAPGAGENANGGNANGEGAQGEGNDGDDGKVLDSHGQPGINKERHDKEVAELRKQIEELKVFPAYAGMIPGRPSSPSTARRTASRACRAASRLTASGSSRRG